jgi:hypothetical protein
MRVLGLSTYTLVGVVLFGLAPALAEDVAIKPFLGTYEGTTLLSNEEIKSRELKVAITLAEDGGFRVEWQTTLFKPKADARRKTQSLEFRRSTENPKVYAAGPSDVTAGMDPSHDPLDGAPYAWARIDDRTLTINVLTISEDGDWVVQVYDRVLTKEGMALSFVRVRNAHVEQRLWGTLERTGD